MLGLFENGKRKKSSRRKYKGDVFIPVIVIALSLFGVVAVYSASSYSAKTQYGSSFFFAKKQLIGFLFGTLALFVCSRFDYRKLKGKKVRFFVYLSSVALLALVFVPGLGKSNYGATRWISLGGVTVQPSEFAKYGFVVFASGYIAENAGRLRTFRGVLPLLSAGGGICVLIMLEPNMSVTVCVGILLLSMIFLGGAKMKTFLWIGIPALAAAVLLILAEPYRLLRLSAFLDPWASPKEEGYQLIQSLYALGNGGWFGTGLFHSRQKYRFLPFAESDFVLAIIGEEIGFFGILLLFSASFFLVYRGISAAAQAEDLHSCMLAAGITLVYGIQTALNALVVSGAIPPTGLPLPLISSGNTSLIVTMASMGILYGISKGHKGEKTYIQ